MDDDAAILVMVDSNLQRETILPSEKAFAYKMKLDAMKRQGKRNDLTSSQIGTKLRSDQILSEQTGDSRNQIARFIRLTNLNPELLDRVDNKTIAVNAAVEVSFLSDSEQTMLIDAIARQEATPTLNQAQRLKKYSLDGKLDGNVMDAIITAQTPLEKKLVITEELLSPYLPKNNTPMQKQQTILKLLADWHKRQMRQQEPER
jgi:ParB family chromosome partitioning protein